LFNSNKGFKKNHPISKWVFGLLEQIPSKKSHMHHHLFASLKSKEQIPKKTNAKHLEAIRCFWWWRGNVSTYIKSDPEDTSALGATYSNIICVLGGYFGTIK
jgi:hypothetical protein